MATLDDIIRRAYRESQTIDIEEDPSPEQQVEALTLLQGILSRNYIPPPQIALTIGRRPERARGQILRDFSIYAPNEPLPQNIVLQCYLTSAKTLMLPYDASDGARISFVDVGRNFATFNLTLEGNGSTIAGADTATLATNGERIDYYYRRDLADWRQIVTLTQFQNMPWPEEFDDMFAIELALRINPRYGNEIPALTAEMLREMRRRFKARYTQGQSSAAPDVLFGVNTIGDGDGGVIF